MDAVLAMSPPLPIGLVAGRRGCVHRCPLVFNVQDVFPDVAIELGKLTDPRLVAGRPLAGAHDLRPGRRGDRAVRGSAGQRRREGPPRRIATRSASSPTSSTPSSSSRCDRRHGLPPRARHRRGAGGGAVRRQRRLLAVARSAGRARRAGWPTGSDLVFVVNGGGSGLAAAQGGRPPTSANVRFSPYQPKERLAEVLASGDLHVVPLRAGWRRRACRPRPTRSWPPAARCWPAIDPGTEVARVVAAAGCGRAVPPDDPDAFTARHRGPGRRPSRAGRHGRSGPGLGRAVGVARGRGRGLRGAVRGGAGPPTPRAPGGSRADRPVASPLRG